MPLGQLLDPCADFLELFLVRSCLLRLRLDALLQVIKACRQDWDKTFSRFQHDVSTRHN
jgi:hypothetical protein